MVACGHSVSEDVGFVGGCGGFPLEVADEVIGLAICFDVAHESHPRAAAERGCTIYGASCFITPEGYAADATLLQQYAQRHRMVVLMANFGTASSRWETAGRSAIWSDKGTLLSVAPDRGEALVIARRHDSRWSGSVMFSP
jgi:predicted amidohydrolase